MGMPPGGRRRHTGACCPGVRDGDNVFTRGSALRLGSEPRCSSLGWRGTLSLFCIDGRDIGGTNTIERRLLELIGEFQKGSRQVRITRAAGKPTAV